MNAKACGAVLLPWAIAFCGCATLEPQRTEYQTVQANPHRNTAWAEKEFGRAGKFAEQGMWDETEQALQQALIADVTYGPAHNNLGKLYYQQKKYYLAAWEFEYASRQMPNRAEPLNNLGLVYEAVDRLDQAIMFFESAYQLEPENPEVIGNLARCRLRRGDQDGEIRRLLGELVFHDTRPDWVGWAKEQLALGKLPADSLPMETSGPWPDEASGIEGQEPFPHESSEIHGLEPLPAESSAVESIEPWPHASPEALETLPTGEPPSGVIQGPPTGEWQEEQHDAPMLRLVP